jgi:hypothetical protein
MTRLGLGILLFFLEGSGSGLGCFYWAEKGPGDFLVLFCYSWVGNGGGCFLILVRRERVALFQWRGVFFKHPFLWVGEVSSVSLIETGRERVLGGIKEEMGVGKEE